MNRTKTVVNVQTHGRQFWPLWTGLDGLDGGIGRRLAQS